MEQFLILVLVKLISPIGIALALCFSLILHKKWAIYMVSIATVIAIDSLIASINPTVNWGMAIAPGIVASCLHVFICIWGVNKYRESQSGGDERLGNEVIEE